MKRFRTRLTDHVIARMPVTHSSFNTGPCIILSDDFNYIHHESCIVSELANRGGDSKNIIVFDPQHTGHMIRRMRSIRVGIFNGN